MADRKEPTSIFDSAVRLKLVDNGDGSYSLGTSAAGGGGSSDTELPAAAALADGAANPTTPTVGAAGLVFNGATWDRRRSASADALAATGIAAAGNMVWNGTTWDRMANPENASASLRMPGVGLMVRTSASAYDPVISLAAAVDNGANGNRGPIVHGVLFNGTTYDRARNNLEATLLASAARTTTQTGADITTYNLGAITVILDMTAVGTGSVTLPIEGKDPASGKYFTLLSGAAVITNVTNVYVVDPAVPAVANVSAQKRLPRTIRINVTANNANSATYSVGYILQPV